jgi:hypothetical protein
MLSSCGEPKGGPRLDVAPVEGEVFVDGKPALEGFVHLHPVTPHEMPRPDQAIASKGQVDEEGKFKVSTYVNEDGAPPGEYKITITWNEATGVMLNSWEGPDRLKGKYANVETTQFSVTVPERPDGPVVIPRFDLTVPSR